MANDLFETYNVSRSILCNGFNVIVSKSGIRESIEKIYYNEQKEYLLEHLIILKNLSFILEKLILVNQALETKNRKKYISWNYFLENIYINGRLFLLEIEIVSMNNGENHYRVQRLKLL